MRVVTIRNWPNAHQRDRRSSISIDFRSIRVLSRLESRFRGQSASRATTSSLNRCRDSGRICKERIADELAVSWQWSGGAPGGTASEVATEGELKMETKSGNEVKKNADPENPAVRVERSGHDVVKRASELEVEEEGPKHKDGEAKKDEGEKNGEEKNGEEKNGGEKDEAKSDEKKDDEEKKDDKEEKATNGDASTGDKRKAEDEKKDDKADGEKAEKAEEPKENGDQPPPKKKGRPAKNSNAPKAEKPKKEPKKAATETGEPRRSGRNRS